MKKPFLFIIVLIISTHFLSCSSREPDFRNVNWGMTEEEVRKNETEPLIEGGMSEQKMPYLYNHVIVDNYTAMLKYYFSEGKLISACYEFRANLNTDKLRDILYETEEKLNLKYIKISGGQWVDGDTAISLSSDDKMVVVTYINEKLNQERLKRLYKL